MGENYNLKGKKVILIKEKGHPVAEDLYAKLEEACAKVCVWNVTGMEVDNCQGHASIKDDAAMAKLAGDCAESAGAIDAVINCLALPPAEVLKVSLEELKDEDWHAVIEQKLNGSFACIKAAGSILKKQDNGAIINLCSGLEHLATPWMTHYASADAGLVGVIRVIASDLRVAKSKVTANLIEIGSHELLPLAEEERVLAGRQKRTSGDDIMSAIEYLVAAKTVTGQHIMLDGDTYYI